MSNQHAVPTNQKTLKGYIKGVMLSLSLTVVAFLLVGLHICPQYQPFLSNVWVVAIVSGLAIVQLIVQVHYFLGLNRQEGKWDFSAFLFTIFVVFIVLIGSLWIMYSLNYNMMH